MRSTSQPGLSKRSQVHKERLDTFEIGPGAEVAQLVLGDPDVVRRVLLVGHHVASLVPGLVEKHLRKQSPPGEMELTHRRHH